MEKNVNDLSESLKKIITNYRQRCDALNNISNIFENFSIFINISDE